MNSTPFSVAMSVYIKDDPQSFDRALESITDAQSIKPDEIVLVCDGELNEELDTVIEKYQNKWPIFNIIRLEQNGGLGNALRIAIESANNELIARMDSDDVSVSDRFEQELNYFCQHPQIDIVGGDITEFISNETNVVGKRCVPQSDADIKSFMKKRAAFNHVTVMYKKSSVLNAGGYKDWFWNEDYYLWIRMQMQGCSFANTGTVLVNVRVGEEMYQRRGGKKYFISEYGLQKMMLDNGMINIVTFVSNVAKRFVVQIMLPNRIRGWVFRHFARS